MWSTVSAFSCERRSSSVRPAVEKTLSEEVLVAGADRIHLAHMLNLAHAGCSISHRAILIAHESIEFVVEQCIKLFQISPR